MGKIALFCRDSVAVAAILGIGLGAGWIRVALAAPTPPTDVQLPGTQPGEVFPLAGSSSCLGCHSGTTNRDLEPGFGWAGSAMANAGRDPIFWAALAIAEQDFVPGSDPATRGGAGDLCLRCHAPAGWLMGRARPTDGSGLDPVRDAGGVGCQLCHILVNPDLLVNVPLTIEVQQPPFISYDDVSGAAYYGSAQLVINGEGSRLGPYGNPVTFHEWRQSTFNRESELCGTCHDVSNPVVGDLAHNNGAMRPLPAGSFSGVLGGPVADKAAFNNPPQAYGVVERTYSEWKASAYSSLLVNGYPGLPADLRVAGGALDDAYRRAVTARADANYEDGAQRYFTCQTCHLSAATGVGCTSFDAPTRTDLPRHDLTGAAYWLGDAILYQDDYGLLRFGGPVGSFDRTAILAAKGRAIDMLRSAASLTAIRTGADLVVRVTNLTGHKLTSGYAEGRRMWLDLRWFDDGGRLLRADGGYGPIGRVVNDRAGVPHAVESLLDPATAIVYEVEPGMDQEWAGQLLGLGYDPGLVLAYDRATDAITSTLGDLAGSSPGTELATFHFALNNVTLHDDRIPPFGLQLDRARERNATPIPETLYGAPPVGGIYQHWAEERLVIPTGAARVEVRLRYQQVTWEYVQFLWLQNDGLSPFLGAEGSNLLDTWLNAGMAAPVEMARATVWLVAPVPGPGEASRPAIANAQMLAVKAAGGAIEVHYTPACNGTDHTIYAGPLAGHASYSYGEAACNLGDGGRAVIDPLPADAFFVVVGNNGVVEGSYGLDGVGGERPEAAGLPGCDWPQDLSARCD